MKNLKWEMILLFSIVYTDTTRIVLKNGFRITWSALYVVMMLQVNNNI